MFIEYEDCFLWSCNHCSKEVAFKPHDFYDCVAELKARGWSFYRDEGEWRHTCGFCNYKHRQTSVMNKTFKTVG